MGFIQPQDMPATGLNKKVETTAVEAARRKFSPEFMNRLDKVVVFHPLKREELDEVLEIELGQVQQRVLDCATSPFQFRITNEGRQFLCKRAPTRDMEHPHAAAYLMHLATAEVRG